MSKKFLYTSRWSRHDGAPGLTLLSLDDETGELQVISQEDNTRSFNCSFVGPNRDILYVNNETDKVPGIPYKTGLVCAYSIDPETGHLTELCTKPTLCPNPAYTSIDPTGRYIVVAHHSEFSDSTVIEQDENGSFVPVIVTSEAVVELIELKEDGTFGEILDVKKHSAETFDPYKQIGGCHPHSAVFSPSGKLIAVCDKGDGYVYIYTIDYENRKLKLLSKTMADTFINNPRYCAFHPTKPYLYVNNEKVRNGEMHVCVFKYDEDGSLELIDVKNALPEDYALPENSRYEQQCFCISPDGSYLYTELNGPNMIGVFKINEDGTITLIQNAHINGVWPRGMALSPNGKFLIIGCLVSGDVISYRVESDGRLSETGYKADVPGAAYFSIF